MNLWRLYRMRTADYDAMRVAQQYRCAACGAHESEIEVPSKLGRPRKDGTRATAFALQVDHCHESGAVRGLLCGNCNRIIGMAKECPEVLDGCAAYLRNLARLT